MSEDLPERLVGAANAIYGSHARNRALHAKGIWCEGSFTGSPEAAAMCRAAYLSGAAIPAIVRFSNGGGNPASNDANREVRGLAVKLLPEGGDEADLLATTTPAFVARTAEDFCELLQARVPDPETGEPDMERLGAYLAAHPEAQAAIQGTLGVEVPASFATVPYFSPHAFRFLGADGTATWAKARWIPLAGEHRLIDDEAQALGRDYLHTELPERLEQGPVEFDLVLAIAGEDDSLDDPTAVWPDDREQLVAGRLTVERSTDDPEAGGSIHVFDPMRLPDGVEPSDDPILHIRHSSYSVSAYARLE